MCDRTHAHQISLVYLVKMECSLYYSNSSYSVGIAQFSGIKRERVGEEKRGSGSNYLPHTAILITSHDKLTPRNLHTVFASGSTTCTRQHQTIRVINIYIYIYSAFINVSNNYTKTTSKQHIPSLLWKVQFVSKLYRRRDGFNTWTERNQEQWW